MISFKGIEAVASKLSVAGIHPPNADIVPAMSIFCTVIVAVSDESQPNKLFAVKVTKNVP